MNFVGELGWELHHPIEHQQKLYDALMQAGKEFDISDFGLRAMDSMRLEKGYPMWGHDLDLEYSALESNLGFFVKLDKESDFEGKSALIKQSEQGIKNKLVLLELHATEVDASTGMEPVYANNQVVGRVTSGGYGHRSNKSLALAFVNVSALEAELSVKVLGTKYRATVTSGCVFDTKNERLRSND
jgi:dimethylglycine dehydrogenase